MTAAKLAAFVAVVVQVSQYTIRMSMTMTVLRVGVSIDLEKAASPLSRQRLAFQLRLASDISCH